MGDGRVGHKMMQENSKWGEGKRPQLKFELIILLHTLFFLSLFKNVFHMLISSRTVTFLFKNMFTEYLQSPGIMLDFLGFHEDYTVSVFEVLTILLEEAT